MVRRFSQVRGPATGPPGDGPASRGTLGRQSRRDAPEPIPHDPWRERAALELVPDCAQRMHAEGVSLVSTHAYHWLGRRAG